MIFCLFIPPYFTHYKYKKEHYCSLKKSQTITSSLLLLSTYLNPINTLFDTTTLHVTITIPEHKMHYGIKVEFDKDQTESLKEIKINDKIKFEATCADWGYYTEAKLRYWQ